MQGGVLPMFLSPGKWPWLFIVLSTLAITGVGCGTAPYAAHRGSGLLQSRDSSYPGKLRGPASHGAPFLVPRKRVVSAEGFAWPLRVGSVSSFYGARDGSFHEGLDIRAYSGTPIYVAREGVVLYSGRGIRGYGNVVIVRHGGGLATVYAHNRRNVVRRGQTLRQGELIGYVGATGHATGPHLHFEVRRQEIPQDPIFFLPLGPTRSGVALRLR